MFTLVCNSLQLNVMVINFVLCDVVEMMQNQRTEWIDLTNEEENSVNTEVHATANEQDMLSNIDFGNVEDVFDFSAPLVPTPTIIKNHGHPTEPCELMTEEPVRTQPTSSKNEYFRNDGVDNKTVCKQKMSFRCIVCGNTFARSSQLHRHMYIHSAAMPYYCSVCRKRFSKNDHMLAHFYNHRNNTLHYCCVCRKAYNDLEEFSIHCRSHSDSVYIKIAMDELNTDNDSSDSEVDSQKEPITVEDYTPVATSAEGLGPISSVEMKEECITYVDNPLYLSHHKAISINSNVATSYSNTDSLMVSINAVHTLS